MLPNPFPEFRGKVQKMITDSGEPKGLQQTSKSAASMCETSMQNAPQVCPFKNDNCCMAHIVSKQEDFTNQIFMLETVLREAGHLCIFLPKFHCELNPIEMVSFSFIHP